MRRSKVGMEVPPKALPQQVMGCFWAAMGAAVFLAPELTMKLGLRPERLPDRDSKAHEAFMLVGQCFGAQAVMCGLLLLTSGMDRRAYAIWGAAILPFFWFDYTYWKNGFLTPLGSLLDAAGNVLFLTCSAIGAGWLDRFLKN